MGRLQLGGNNTSQVFNISLDLITFSHKFLHLIHNLYLELLNLLIDLDLTSIYLAHRHHTISPWHHIRVHHRVLHVRHLCGSGHHIILFLIISCIFLPSSHLLLHIVIHIIHHKLVKHIWKLSLHFLLILWTHHLASHHRISLSRIEHTVLISLLWPTSKPLIILRLLIWIVNSLFSDLLILDLFLIPIIHWRDSISQINFLNLSFSLWIWGASSSWFLLASWWIEILLDGFNILSDLGTNFHQNNLLAIGCQPIILFT